MRDAQSKVATLGKVTKDKSMALRNFAGFVALMTVFAVGCGGPVEHHGEGTIRLAKATVTKNADSTATLTDGNTVLHVDELADEPSASAGWCCTSCNMQTGHCDFCQTCNAD